MPHFQLRCVDRTSDQSDVLPEYLLSLAFKSQQKCGRPRKVACKICIELQDRCCNVTVRGDRVEESNKVRNETSHNDKQAHFPGNGHD